MNNPLPFWKQKSLQEMTPEEWESLCDGCALCCLHKLEDEDTSEVHYTRVACRMLDIHTCRCKDYANRQTQVPDCLSLRTEAISKIAWLPASCAYRLVAEGKDLPFWHPLVCGDPSLLHTMEISIRSFAIEEKDGMDLEDYLL